MNQNFSFKSLLTKLNALVSKYRRYSLVIFIVFVALIYGFILTRINSLRSLEPTPDAISSQVKAARTPHIDAGVVKKLESLEDNSVSVQALFDQARSNPFQ